MQVAWGLGFILLLFGGLILDAALAHNRWWETSGRVYWLVASAGFLGTFVFAGFQLIRSFIRGTIDTSGFIIALVLGSPFAFFFVSGAWVRARTPLSARSPRFARRGDPRDN